MTLIKYSPVKEFENLHNNLMRYFDDFPTFRKSFADDFSPRMDVTDNENSIVIKAEVPGVDKKDINISIKDKILTIEGEKKNEVVDENANYYRSERSFGSFKRQFQLPDEVEAEKVDAKYENGILTIDLKKKEVVHPEAKVIKVK
jgi:HSP20 family protein